MPALPLPQGGGLPRRAAVGTGRPRSLVSLQEVQHGCRDQEDFWQPTWSESPRRACRHWINDTSGGALSRFSTLRQACDSDFARELCAGTCCELHIRPAVCDVGDTTSFAGWKHSRSAMAGTGGEWFVAIGVGAAVILLFLLALALVIVYGEAGISVLETRWLQSSFRQAYARRLAGVTAAFSPHRGNIDPGAPDRSAQKPPPSSASDEALLPRSTAAGGLSEEELAFVTVAQNRTSAPFPSAPGQDTAHALMDIMAAEHPTAIAVSHAGSTERITYAEVWHAPPPHGSPVHGFCGP